MDTNKIKENIKLLSDLLDYCDDEVVKNELRLSIKSELNLLKTRIIVNVPEYENKKLL